MKKLLFCSSMFFAMLLLHNFAWSQCDASFSYIATSATTYHFSSNQPLQTGYTYYHTWRVDDNVWSHAPSADRTFSPGADYEVCHVISIQDSAANTICIDSECVYLQITTQAPCFPQVNVSAVALSHHEFQFSNSLADYTNVTIRWNFGDGTSATGIAAPQHYYSAFGTYTACLILTDTVRLCSSLYCTTVRPDSAVIDPCQLSGYFTAVQPALTSTNVVFTQNISGTYHTVLWVYGDGDSSDVFQPSHQYPAYGNYNACATYTDTILGCVRHTCRYVELDSCQSNFANFDIGSSAGFSRYFYPTELYSITPQQYQWDFGDGTGTSTQLNPYHTYSTVDTFNVCLAVAVAGCIPDTFCKTIITECALNAYYTQVMTGPNTIQFHSQANGNNLRYQWLFGDGTVADEQHPVHVYGASAIYNACLVAMDTISGCVDTTCTSLIVTAFADTICGNVFADYNYNGIQEATEPGMSGISILCQPSGVLFTTDSTGHYEGLVPWDLFSTNLNIKLLYSPQHLNTIPLASDNYQYMFSFPNIRQCGFDFGVATFSSRVSGYVFADYNQDGQTSTGEPVIPRQLVKRGNTVAITGSDGHYVLDMPIGIHTIWRDTLGAYAGIPGIPASYSVNAFQPGTEYAGRNFGIGIGNTYSDMTVDLIPVSPVALAYKAEYRLLATNLGATTPLAGFGMVHDAALVFDAANSPGINYNAGTRTTSISALSGPFSQTIKKLVFDPAAGTVMNQNIYNNGYVNVIIGTEANTANNNDAAHQIVVASFDPNNKLADDCGTGSQGYIQHNQKLKFVINFENTGTYYAMNIVLQDVIDANFDLSTFRYIGASHDNVCDVKLIGDTVYFRFTKIRLPYTKPESQGWVAFEIAPKPNLPFNTQLHNTAAIYFDHNEPVITNTTLHTIGGPEAITAFKEQSGVIATPNPFSSEVTISTQHITGENCSYTLSDLLGHTLLAGKIATGTNLTIKRNSLPAGTYIISVFSEENRPVHLKIVAE
ncbi:MAG TPA: PKD domain-containing protein [Chitinophagales bacterium]|nr:PKD domain-containing protein [Chitinophagales bacterium]